MEYGELLALLRSSRTFRRFDESVQLGEDDLRPLIEAVRFAPTGSNTQLLRYHPVVGEKMCRTAFSHVHWAAALKDWDGPEAGERPGGYILILAPEAAVSTPIRCHDAGIAAQTIMLAARTLGLGGCIMKSFDKELLEDMGLDGQGYAISLVLALGRPAEKVVIETPETAHGLAYWHEADGSQHVPKLTADDLII